MPQDLFSAPGDRDILAVRVDRTGEEAVPLERLEAPRCGLRARAKRAPKRLGGDPDRPLQTTLQGDLFQALEILGHNHTLIKIEMLIIYEYLYKGFREMSKPSSLILSAPLPS
jgi:hypothetical protein